jgi:hemerythrin
MSLVWESSFSVGVASLDLQHQRILALIAELRSHLDAAPGALDREDILFRLTAYIHEHFQHEEGLMARAGYPALAAHLEDHRAFTREVASRCMEAFDGPAQSHPGLLPFLESWWRHHVLETDMAYKPFLKMQDGD